MEMVEGLITMYKNLREAVEAMDNIDATWLPIQLNPKGLVSGIPLARIPPFSTSWSLQRALLTRSCVHWLEKNGRSFDAAYFNTASPAFFLGGFRRRVPCVDALDATPIILKRYGYNKPRAAWNPLVRRLRHRLAQNAFRDATHLLPWSRFAKESLIRDYGIPEDKITIVPPGIDLETWSDHSDNSQRAETSANKLRVLFVGGNFARKGGDLLLSIAGKEEFQQCDFHFVTKGFKGSSGPNIFVYDNLAANSEALISLYRQADIFALPSRADFFPLAALEAMAMGLPVLITKVGGIDEIVMDGETGFIVPTNSDEGFVDRLRVLVRDPELRTRLGRNGRRVAESRFDLERMAETVVRFLVKAANTRNAGNERLASTFKSSPWTQIDERTG
jgi:glycosyltransferase involved in cell wall biosynthesis